MNKRILAFAACLVVGLWIAPKPMRNLTNQVSGALPVRPVGTILITDSTGTKWVAGDTQDIRCTYDADSPVKTGGQSRIGGQVHWNGKVTCRRDAANPFDTSSETR